MTKYLLTTMMVLLLASCTKQVEQVRADKEPGIGIRGNAATGLRQGTNRFAATSPTTAVQIFQGVDPVALQAALNTSNNTLNPLIANLAAQLRSYFETTHQVDFVAEELNFTNAEMVLAGMIFAGIEMGYFNEVSSFRSNGVSLAPDFSPMFVGGEQCFYAILDNLVNLTLIQLIVSDFRRGTVGPATIMRTIKVAAGRIATVWTIGRAIFELGTCLEWW